MSTGLGLVTSAVCEECNNGWMASLERRAKTLLRSLMSGKLTVWLSVEDLEVIRDWIIKTVMAIDAANPADGRFFLPVERETYWRERRIGPALSGTIGIGVYSGTRHGVYSVMFHRVVEFAKERHPSKHARVYCCTLQMERFLAQLLLIRELPGVTASNFRRDRRFDRYVLSIGRPTRGRQWPGVPGVGDEDLEAFTDRFHVRSMDPASESVTLNDFNY
jgi:hypothetical protein